ncbi:MAG: hypothetical protein JSW70_06290 [Syntrophobacterales bacterium]|nr:MAG: hypothetical protein JSW70_06290 [Syntrophobacterales bacterium]
MYKARVKKEKITVKIQTLQNRIEGNVYLLPNARITDMLNQEGSQFIPITDAKIYSLKSGSLVDEAEFVTINKNQVVLIVEKR